MDKEGKSPNKEEISPKKGILGVNIWEAATKQSQVTDQKLLKDKRAIFVGEKGVGKTCLITNFCGVRDSELKPTAALDFTYRSKPTEEGFAMANLYELGGGSKLSQLLPIPFKNENILFSVPVIVLDLSNVKQIFASLKFWINKIREIVSKEVAAQDSLNQFLVTEAKQRIGEIWDKHEDRKNINPLPIPLVIVGNKVDIFSQNEPETKKWVCRALRYMAHRNGCSLLFTSMSDKTSLQAFKSHLTHHLYYNEVLPTRTEKDHLRPLCIRAGADTLASIGQPKTINPSLTKKMHNLDDIWIQVVSEYFPGTLIQIEEESKGDVEQNADKNIEKYMESRIDALKKQKEDEFRKYRHHIKEKKVVQDHTLLAERHLVTNMFAKHQKAMGMFAQATKEDEDEEVET